MADRCPSRLVHLIWAGSLLAIQNWASVASWELTARQLASATFAPQSRNAATNAIERSVELSCLVRVNGRGATSLFRGLLEWAASAG